MLVVQHAARPVYDLPVAAVVAGVIGALASIAGWTLVVRAKDGVVLASALVGFLYVAAVLTLFSIGILVLLVAVAVTIAVIRAAGRRRAAGRPVPGRTALAAALLVGLGLPTAALVASDGPLVQCHPNGVSSSSSIFRSSSGSSSGSSTSGGGSNGSSSGTMSNGDRHYEYRCEGDRLVEFEVLE